MTATNLERHADRLRSGPSFFRGCRDLLLLLVFTGLTLPVAASARPLANDDFTNRISLAGTVVVTASNVGATTEASEPVHAGEPGGLSLWWSWTAVHTGRVTMGTSGSEVDTLLAVYTGTALATLVEVASNDDASFGVITSRIAFNSLAGTTYQIALDAYEAEEGEVRLTILVNDAFADRLALVGTNLSVAGHNFDATAEPKEPAHAGRSAMRSVWWTWTAPSNGLVGLVLSGDNTNSAGGNFYRTLAVYTGGTLSNLTARASSGNLLSLTNRLAFDAAANTIYQIAADGVNGSAGQLQLALAFTNAPANDHFDDAIPLAGPEVSVSGSNVAASMQSGEPSHAASGGRSVWWRWTAPLSGPVVISTAGSSFNTLLAVYTGSVVGALDPVASNNDFAGGPASQVSFNAVAGIIYGIAVDGLLGDSGDIRLTLAQQGEWRLEMPGFAGDGAFEFSFVGQVGTSYVIEGSTNLAQWDGLETLTNSTGRVIFRDGSTTNFPHRFYRARLP